MVQHGAALCQLWRVQMTENAQNVPKFPPARAPQAGAPRDASRTSPPRSRPGLRSDAMTWTPSPTTPGSRAADYPCPPSSATPRATTPQDGHPAPAEALRLGKAMRHRLHTAVTAAVTAARQAEAPDAAALGLLVLMAKTSAQDGTARIWAAELGRWLGVGQSTVAHDVLPALRNSGLLATRPLTDATGRTRGLECVVMPMWRVRRDGRTTHPLALTRPELATLLRFLEALIGPGWQPSDPGKAATPAGLLAERTGRGAATDRLALVLMALNTTDRGRLRLCPGTVDARRGRPATTVARLLSATPAAGAKVLARLSAHGVVAVTQAATKTGMDGKSRVVLPALVEALRPTPSCPSRRHTRARIEEAPRHTRGEAAANAPSPEPTPAQDPALDRGPSPLALAGATTERVLSQMPPAEEEAHDAEGLPPALGDLELHDRPSAQRHQGMSPPPEHEIGGVGSHNGAAHLHAPHSSPPGDRAQIPESGCLSGEAVGGATTVAGSARARARRTPPARNTSPAHLTEKWPGANTATRPATSRRRSAAAGTQARTFQPGVREVLDAIAPIRDALNPGQLVTAAAAINAVLRTTSPLALSALLQARLAPMIVGTPAEVLHDRGVIVSPLGWLLSQLPQVTRCPDCGYTFHGRRTGTQACSPCRARREGRTTAPCRDCGQDRDLTAGRICRPCSADLARLTVCGACGTRTGVHPVTGLCPPCESEARSRSAEELSPLSEEGQQVYLRLTRGNTPAPACRVPQPPRADTTDTWTARLRALAGSPLPEDERPGRAGQGVMLRVG
jgi:hypothetical protein